MMNLLPIACCFLLQTPTGVAETPVDKVIAAHNRERAERKLPPLKHEPRLTTASKEHAADMAKRGIMEHEGGDHSTPADRVQKQKYPYLATAENVAKGQKTVDDVMRAWMASPHHRDNILGDFVEIGVARQFATDGTPFWCVEFGLPFPKLDTARAEAEAFERLNHARADVGLDAFKLDQRLAKIARDLASEESPPSKKATELIDKSGYLFEKAACLNSSGVPTPEALVRALLGNDVQRTTVQGNFTEVGVGYAFGTDGRPRWCLIVAKPPNTQKP